MTNLLAPRFKVELPYPNSPFEVGQIIAFTGSEFGLCHIDKFGTPLFVDHFEKYPHLFRKLEWWEDREVSEMPEFVKSNYENGTMIKGSIHKVKNWLTTKDEDDLRHNPCPYYLRVEGLNNRISARNITPATLSDYTAYINQTKPTI